MRPTWFIAGFGFLFFSPSSVRAQDARAVDRGRFTLDLANDDFGSDRDEAFTSGIEAILRFVPGENISLFSIHSDWKKRRVQEYWGFLFGHQIYTPALLSETDLSVLREDRRYAGWVYGSLFTELLWSESPFILNGYSFLRARLTFGLTGPQTRTDILQRYWHAFIRDVLNRTRLPEDPKGWPVYQVPDHFGVNLRLDYETEVYRWQAGWDDVLRSTGSDLAFRISPLAQVRLGNVWIDGYIGAALRFGLMPEAVVDDLGFVTFAKEEQEGETRRPDIAFSLYGFGSGRIIGSIYDAFLDGPPGAIGPYPERNPVMVQLEAGFALRLAMVEFMFRHTTLSPQLASRPGPGVWIQNWGRFTVTFVFD